jgi:hypothetical protein
MMPEETVRVIVLGGCQITGYPFNCEDGFVQIGLHFLQREGIIVTQTLVEHVALSKRSTLLAQTRAFEPSIVVLQLGHYETALPFSRVIRKLLGLSRSNRGNSSGSSTQSASSVSIFEEASMLRRSVWVARMHIRNAFDIALFSPRVRLFEYESCFDEMVVGLIAQGHTIVNIEPMPCADLAINRTRRKVAEVMRRICSERRVENIRSSEEIYSAKAEGRSWRKFHFDSIHISRHAHKKLGRALGIVLKSILASNSFART